MTVFMTILKKLAAICWRVLTNDKCRIFPRSAVTPVWTTSHPPTRRRKIWTCELGNNGRSVLDTLILEGEKPPPCGCAAP